MRPEWKTCQKASKQNYIYSQLGKSRVEIVKEELVWYVGKLNAKGMISSSQGNWSVSFSPCLPKSGLPVKFTQCSIETKDPVLHPMKTVAKLQPIWKEKSYVFNACVEKQLPISVTK